MAIGIGLSIAQNLAADSPDPVDSLRALLKESPSAPGKARINLELSKIYLLEDYKRALNYARTAISIAKGANLQKEREEAIRMAGRVCFHAGLMEMASRYFNDHLRLISKNGSKLDLGAAYVNLGAVRIFLEDLEHGKSYNLNALKMFEEYAKEQNKGRLPPNVLSVYNNLGIIFREQKEFEEANLYFNKGIAMSRKSQEYRPNLIKLLNNQAIQYMVQDNLAEAARNLEESLRICIATKDKPSESATRLNLGKLYRKGSDFIKALESCKAAYRLALDCNGIDLGYNATGEIYAIYKETGPADSTLKYLALSQDLLKQINIAKTREDMARQELEKYYREKELAEKQKQQRLLRFEVLVLVLGISAFAGLLLFYLRTKRALDKTVKEKNNRDQTIETLASQRDQLSTELENKERQLAVEALHRFKNKEMLEDVTEKLLDHVKSSKEESQDLIKKVLRDLQRTKDRAASLRQFEISFLNFQKDFFEKLGKINPHLSPNERRLCAFLRLDMSSKDISALTGQSVNSINVARIRLRKKLRLTNTSVSLTDFLANL